MSQQPVPINHHLELHQQMLNSVEKSLQHTKKRLHDAELTLNLKPSTFKQAELSIWNEKIHQLITKRDVLPFPTLYEVRKQAEIREMSEKESDDENKKVENKVLKPKTVEHIKFPKKSVQAKESNEAKRQYPLDGGPTIGNAIRSIDQYNGMNTYYKNTTRTLVQKDTITKLDTKTSSLPNWFGPQYYENTDPTYFKEKPDNFYQYGFKTTSRNVIPNEKKLRNDVLRRKSTIRNLTKSSENFHQQPDNHSTASSSLQNSTIYRRNSASFDETSKANSKHSLFITTYNNSNNNNNNNSREKLHDINNNNNNPHHHTLHSTSNRTITTYNTSDGHSHSPDTRNHCKQKHIKEKIDKFQLPTTYAAHNDLIFKLNQSKISQKYHTKTKDYTFKGLIHQLPLKIDTKFEDTPTVDQQQHQQQQQQHDSVKSDNLNSSPPAVKIIPISSPSMDGSFFPSEIFSIKLLDLPNNSNNNNNINNNNNYNYASNLTPIAPTTPTLQSSFKSNKFSSMKHSNNNNNMKNNNTNTYNTNTNTMNTNTNSGVTSESTTNILHVPINNNNNNINNKLSDVVSLNLSAQRNYEASRALIKSQENMNLLKKNEKHKKFEKYRTSNTIEVHNDDNNNKDGGKIFENIQQSNSLQQQQQEKQQEIEVTTTKKNDKEMNEILELKNDIKNENQLLLINNSSIMENITEKIDQKHMLIDHTTINNNNNKNTMKNTFKTRRNNAIKNQKNDVDFEDDILNYAHYVVKRKILANKSSYGIIDDYLKQRHKFLQTKHYIRPSSLSHETPQQKQDFSVENKTSHKYAAHHQQQEEKQEHLKQHKEETMIVDNLFLTNPSNVIINNNNDDYNNSNNEIELTTKPHKKLQQQHFIQNTSIHEEEKMQSNNEIDEIVNDDNKKTKKLVKLSIIDNDDEFANNKSTNKNNNKNNKKMQNNTATNAFEKNDDDEEEIKFTIDIKSPTYNFSKTLKNWFVENDIYQPHKKYLDSLARLRFNSQQSRSQTTNNMTHGHHQNSNIYNNNNNHNHMQNNNNNNNNDNNSQNHLEHYNFYHNEDRSHATSLSSSLYSFQNSHNNNNNNNNLNSFYNENKSAKTSLIPLNKTNKTFKLLSAATVGKIDDWTGLLLENNPYQQKNNNLYRSVHNKNDSN